MNWGMMAALVFAIPQACFAAESTLLEDYSSALEVPAGDDSSICRMDLDITGDGTPELFLSTSYLGGAYGQSWVIYRHLDDGKLRRYGDPLDFHYKAFYFAAEESTFSYYVRASREEGGFTKLRAGATSFEPITGPYSLTEEQARVVAWTRQRPSLYCASLQTVRDGTATWRDYVTNEPTAGLQPLTGTVVP